jgi:phosphatidyl-myo-inositol alpha-mannosyltransferase
MTRRVALVSPYALSVFGGVQEQVLAMSRELARRGDDVLVVAPDERDAVAHDTPATLARFGRRLALPANGSRAPLTLSPLAARRARRAVTGFGPDVVHFHEPFAPLVGWGALRAHVAPAVATFHRSGEGPATTLTRPLLRWLARGIDVAAAVSDSAAATMGRASGTAPRVLFNGFETERFVEHPRERTGEVVLVTVGRLEQRKGTRTAIEAVMAHNARSSPPWRLVVIGEGPEGASLGAFAGSSGHVTFTGAVSDAEKRQWYRRANALVAPALRGESFGLVLLEAMASETVVVASDIDGYRAAAAGEATLFAPGDPVALEAAIGRALAAENPEAIARARAHAQRWSMRALVDAYEELYDLAGRRFSTTR